jgi:hypothetical protein
VPHRYSIAPLTQRAAITWFTAMQKLSSNSLLSSALALQDSSEFAFVTITNPHDIKDPRTQSRIRRHARNKTSTSKRKRKQQIELVFDLSDAASGVRAGTSGTGWASSVDTGQSARSTGVVGNEHYIGRYDTATCPPGYWSWDSLRPMGSGRGLDPLRPFPVAANGRLRHLINFGLNFTPVTRSELI